MTESGIDTLNTQGTVGPLACWQGRADQPVLNETVADVLHRQARDYPDRPALMWLETEGLAQISYAELLAAAETAARWMLSKAQPGERVAIWSRNSVDWAILEYGCALAGMNLAAWNTSWTDFEVSHAIELTDPRIVFAGVDTRGVSLRERADVLARGRVVENIAASRNLVPAYSGELPMVELDTPFLVQFTSGTTGRAKGAQLSHRAAMNGGYFRALSTGGTKEDIYLNSTPMHHMAGSVSLLLGSLSIAACYVIMSNSSPADLIRAARLSHATRFGGVPTMIIAMLEHPEFPKGELKFRTVGLGGTQVPEALIRRVSEEFAAIVSVGYAQSECPLISNTLPDDPVDIIATTVGKPYAGNDVKIIDAHSRETVRMGEVGELCVRSAAMMSGYYNAPEATKKAFDAEGFLRTGDLATMDEFGYLRIQGRAREVIIRGGENIYPIEVEEALHQHPAVSLAAVVAVPDEKWGQQVGAVIRLVPGGMATEAELEDFVRQRVAHFKVPRFWRIVDGNELPMTASGKVKKVELSAFFENTRASKN